MVNGEGELHALDPLACWFASWLRSFLTRPEAEERGSEGDYLPTSGSKDAAYSRASACLESYSSIHQAHFALSKDCNGL